MARKTRRCKVVVSSAQHAVRVPRKRIAELIEHVAAAEPIRLAAVDLAVVGSAEMAALNRRYARSAGPTDVLSFDLSAGDDEAVTAQVVVCGDIAAEEGRLRGTSGQAELLLYVVHALLHLAGYEDATAGGAARMHARAAALLDGFRVRLARRRRSCRRR